MSESIFSPLNISEIDEDQKDEKEKQLLANISRISEEAEMLDGRMLEIKDFLQDIETMLDDDSKDSLSGFLLKKEKNRITVEDFYKKHEPSGTTEKFKRVSNIFSGQI